MAVSRRIFLRNSAFALAGIGSAPLWLQRAALGAEQQQTKRKKVLVAIFQRGAADGLNIVVPHAEQRYYDLRPTISIPRPSAKVSAADAVIDLDGFFGLHPSLAPLVPLWQKQQLAIIHAAGSPDPTRSHFDAQDYMESGTPGLKATTGGWLNRALPREASPSAVRAVSLGANMSRTLAGANKAIAVENLGNFNVRENSAAKAMQAMYTSTGDQILGGTGRETFDAVSILQSIQKTPYQPAEGATYPRGRFGDSMKQIAQLIKADVGLEVAFADIGNWDHHVNEVGPKASVGVLANVLGEFGGSLAAFCQDLGDRMEDVVVVTMSEFGRTAKENGNRGTDHGHANVMFAMGGPVAGGKVYGQWPGLAQEQLNDGRDLALTTDFRDVLSEAVWQHLGNHEIQPVFPNYAASPDKFRGFLRT